MSYFDNKGGRTQSDIKILSKNNFFGSPVFSAVNQVAAIYNFDYPLKSVNFWLSRLSDSTLKTITYNLPDSTKLLNIENLLSGGADGFYFLTYKNASIQTQIVLLT